MKKEKESISCLGLIGACILGITSVAAIGSIAYDWITAWGIHTGVFTHDPIRNNQADGFGEALGLTFTVYAVLLLYLITGTIAGVLASVQFFRFSRYWSPRTKQPIIVVTLLNGIATLVGTGMLSGLLAVRLFTDWSRSSEPITSTYAVVTWIANILALGLLSLNFLMPRLVRSMAARR
ncbi:MAG: hypothetical protein AAFW75_05820 [Cyanobacteria bacterium J06636_16]